MTIYRSSWCEIDVSQFRTNLSMLKRVSGTKMLLVVKANAYGHGLVPMAIAAEEAGVDMLGVATIDEADRLLVAGIRTPILIMCALDSHEIDYCVAKGVHFLAWRLDHFQAAISARTKHERRPLIHLEADTGMSRSGAAVTDLGSLLNSLSPDMIASIVGLASHFTSADLDDLAASERQLKDFQECVELTGQHGIRPMLHLANSPGALRLPSSRMEMVRMGIAAYGLPPSDHTLLPPGVSAVLNWKATITNVKDIGPGQGVGYGWQFVADDHERVATIAIGYADGFRRYPRHVNSVLMRAGESAAVVGSVFMDQCLIKVPRGVRCEVGDSVVLLGRQGDGEITAEDLAARWGTNNYDVVSGIRDRVPRKYLPSRA